jgi:hypothetical protein
VTVLDLAEALGVEVGAFAEELGDVPPASRGRPRKEQAEAPPAKKKGRGKK